jgi:hypothetical protein
LPLVRSRASRLSMQAEPARQAALKSLTKPKTVTKKVVRVARS